MMTMDTQRLPSVSVRRLPSPQFTLAAVLFARLGFLLVFHFHSRLVGQGGFNAAPYGGLDDGRYYYETAQMLANGEQPEYVLNAFPQVLAFFMRLGVEDLLALKLMSFAVSSIAVVLAGAVVWDLTLNLGEQARRFAVVLVSMLGSLLPSGVFWSMNSLMRDGWILSFVMIFIWSTKASGSLMPRTARWSLGVVALLLAGSFRPYVIPVAIAALASSRISLVNPMRGLDRRLLPVLRRLAVLAFGFIVLSLMAGPVIESITGFNILGWRTREELLDKGSSLGFGFEDVDSPVAIAYYMVSVVSNAVGPLPWQIVSANQLLVLTEVPFFIAITAGLLRSSYNNAQLRLCGLFGLYWLLLLGLWNDVLGNAARNRVIAWPILAIVASVALAEAWEGREGARGADSVDLASVQVPPDVGSAPS
jgi:hypothetical protein